MAYRPGRVQALAREAMAEIKEAVAEFGSRAFATSSFQTQGVPMLHMISEVCPGLPVYFLDTGFHFKETYEFKDLIGKQFGLNIIHLLPARAIKDLAAWCRDNGHTVNCCNMLKVHPMEKLLQENSEGCWISGVRKDQTRARKRMGHREMGTHGVVRVHPIIHWTAEDVANYSRHFDLPQHPLTAKGYGSIGCAPCTVPGEGREGRWKGERREGCGIHGLTEQKPCARKKE